MCVCEKDSSIRAPEGTVSSRVEMSMIVLQKHESHREVRFANVLFKVVGRAEVVECAATVATHEALVLGVKNPLGLLHTE